MSTSTAFPGTVATSSANVGITDWANPNNVKSTNSVYATCSVGTGNNTYELLATNYGFAVSGTINGIVASIIGHVNNTGRVDDQINQFIKGGALAGTNYAVSAGGGGPTTGAWATTDSTQTFGTSSTLSGLTLAASDINASGFGFGFQGESSGGTLATSIDAMPITVTYTAGNTYDYTPTGGIALAGSAPLTQGHSYAPTSGLTLAGSGPLAQGHSYHPSSGLFLAGSSPHGGPYAYVPAGGLSLGGSAPKTQGHNYAPGGGLALGGSAPATHGPSYHPAGGLALAGAAPLAQGHNYVPPGGLALGGAAPFNGPFNASPTGGIVLGGEAPNDSSVSHNYVGGGGLTLGGSAPPAQGHSYPPTGGLIFGGSSDTSLGDLIVEAGISAWNYSSFQLAFDLVRTDGLFYHGFTLSNIEAYPYIPTGGIRFSGAAAVRHGTLHDYTATGGIVLSGAAASAHRQSYKPQGGIVLSGVAATVARWSAIPTGGILLSGLAGKARGKNYLPTGGIHLGGAVVTSTVPINIHGRDPIAVDQPYAGSTYPFRQPHSNLNLLIADACLTYTDDLCQFVRPFYLHWLGGFDSGPPQIGAHPAATHPQDAVVVDANGAVVFDSTQAPVAGFRSSLWDNRLLVLEWYLPTAVLRLVQHVAWSLDDNLVIFPSSYFPAAPFEPRVLYQVPQRVLALQLGDVQITGQPELDMGYNIDLVATQPVLVDGGSFVNQVAIGASPGGGTGQAPVDCNTPGQIPLRTINGIGGTALGNFFINTGGGKSGSAASCYRVDQPGVEVTVDPATFRYAAATLQIFNPCDSCCTCDDYVHVYRAETRLHNQFKLIGEQLTAVRNQYADNLARWNAQKACREAQPSQLIVNAECPCALSIAASYCNPATQCVGPIELRFTVQYFRSGQLVDPLDVTLRPVCGQAAVVGAETGGVALPVSVAGAYPVFSLIVDHANPHQASGVQFRLQAMGCQNGDALEVNLTVHAATHSPAAPLPVVAVPAEVSALWLDPPIAPPVSWLQKYVPVIPPADTGNCECR